jgi:hypothetical protein
MMWRGGMGLRREILCEYTRLRNIKAIGECRRLRTIRKPVRREAVAKPQRTRVEPTSAFYTPGVPNGQYHNEAVEIGQC